LRITVVLVTFNRLDCLKLALEKYEEQTLQPYRIIVVDNCSTDGTRDYLKKWKSEVSSIKREVLTTTENLGGAGGFATGLKLAHKYTDTDWIWLADDDAYPEKNAIEEMSNVYNNLNEVDEVVALFSSVINFGKYDLNHRRLVKRRFTGVKFIPVHNNSYSQDYFEINQGSYVGMLVKNSALSKAGITREDYFIYFDDTEHTERLNKFGRLVCIPNSRVVHDVIDDHGISWKSYYSIRNSIRMIFDNYGMFFGGIDLLKKYLKLASIFNRNHSKEVKKMFKIAIIDALKKNMGLHNIYKPGWKPEGY
ncbi:TPA: glycosyltransferase, partial [Streptococcus suis]